MKKRFLLLICSCLLVFSSAYSYVTGETQKFQVMYGFWVKNPYSHSVRIRVDVPIPTNDPPHQKVSVLKVEPKPKKVVNTSTGKRAIFIFDKVPKGSKVWAKVYLNVETQRVVYPIEACKVVESHKYSSFTRSSYKYPVNNPLVKEYVKKVVGDEKNPYYKALKIYDFVRGLNFVLTKGPQSPVDVLKTGMCQCSDATDLFITMCRGAGIPARYIGGVYLKETNRFTQDTHAWSEIYLHPYEWVPVDPTMSRFNYKTRLSRFCEIDAPYLKMWSGEESLFRFYIYSDKNKKQANFGIKVKYKALKKRKGLKAKKFYKNLSFENLQAKNKGVPEYQKAYNLFQLGKLKKAKAILEKLIKEKPNLYKAYILYSKVLVKMGKIEYLMKKMKTLAKGESNPQKIGAYISMGYACQFMGKYSKAEYYIQKAISLGGTPFGVSVVAGGFYFQTKQIPKALKYLNIALKKSPQDVKIYGYLIDILYYLEDYSTSLQLLKKGAKITGSAQFYYEMAWVCYVQEKYKLAEKYATLSVRKSPQNGMYLSLLGKIHWELGKRKKAITEMKKAMQIGVPEKEKKSILKLIRKK